MITVFSFQAAVQLSNSWYNNSVSAKPKCPFASQLQRATKAEQSLASCVCPFLNLGTKLAIQRSELEKLSHEHKELKEKVFLLPRIRLVVRSRPQFFFSGNKPKKGRQYALTSVFCIGNTFCRSLLRMFKPLRNRE